MTKSNPNEPIEKTPHQIDPVIVEVDEPLEVYENNNPCGEIASNNDVLDASANHATPRQKRSNESGTTKSKAPRQRKLRPEDERTLKILSEKFRKDESGIVCKVPNCKLKPLQSSKPCNMKRHLSQMHSTLYKELFPHEVDSQKQAELEAFNAIQDAIELVTVNGYPFAMLNASGMRGFIKSRIRSCTTKGHLLAINRFDIPKRIAEESVLVENRIASEIRGKIVSIMFDVCTIATLSVLGVNATYMNGVDVVCRSLGIIKIEKRHTAVILADMVYDILSKFGITLHKLFSVTTDTARNAKATADVLNLVVSSESSNNEDNAEESIFDIGPDDDEFDFGIDEENETELRTVIAAQTLLIKDVAENIAQNTSIQLINHINCSTHVLQLAVNDALAESNSQKTIQDVHDMCVLMRTQIVMIDVRKLGSKTILPPMDNATRWNSKFIMVCILHSMKYIKKINGNCRFISIFVSFPEFRIVSGLRQNEKCCHSID